VLISLMLAGSAVATLGVGLRAGGLGRRTLLLVVSAVMVGTGIVFGAASSFAVLGVAGLVGTLNPTGGDVSVFLPAEQGLLAGTVAEADRTALVARYTLVGFVLAAAGAAAAGVPDALARAELLAPLGATRSVFAGYALAGVVVLAWYRRLSPAVEPVRGVRVGLGPSRRTVYRLAAVFSIDSFGGGFVGQAVVALWLYRRFDLSVGAAGALFSIVGLLAGCSGLLSARLARRIGLVRTMAFTHLPANALLVATACMPNLWAALACLLARSALAQMDVPARTSYVLAVVTPPERPAAAAVTNVPRSVAAALPPVVAGWLLDRTSFGWPLVIGGVLKAVYDLVLLWQFRSLRPPEEQG
jgi:predicted MFS family arabinose efflux permease